MPATRYASEPSSIATTSATRMILIARYQPPLTHAHARRDASRVSVAPRPPRSRSYTRARVRAGKEGCGALTRTRAADEFDLVVDVGAIHQSKSHFATDSTSTRLEPGPSHHGASCAAERGGGGGGNPARGVQPGAVRCDHSPLAGSPPPQYHQCHLCPPTTTHRHPPPPRSWKPARQLARGSVTARTIPADELTQGLEEWEQDYAVLFHANW